MSDIVNRMTRARNDLMTLGESYLGQRQHEWFLEFAAAVREGRAEIERLQAEIEARKTAAEKVYLEQAAEIERLKVACRDQAGVELSEENDWLIAEIERLRALLRRHQVAAWCEKDSDLAVETRRALEPKP